MRKAFFNTLVELAENDERVYLIVADIGYGLVESFQTKYPDRFINVGVAEQNMIGIATGLALSGKKVFVYSIANFPTLRCLDQIRNDVCYHNVNVCIVAGGTGLAYGALGSSHHATEDIAMMRSLPDITVIAPSTPIETVYATKAIYKAGKPCYLRLGYFDEHEVYADYQRFEIGRSITTMPGQDVVLISTGSMLGITLKAAKDLAKSGIYPLVLNMHTIKPLDVETLEILPKLVKVIVTIEEHSVIGGLGSAVAEVVVGKNVSLKIMGIRDVFSDKVGSRDELLKENGLTVDDIVEVAVKALKKVVVLK